MEFLLTQSSFKIQPPSKKTWKEKKAFATIFLKRNDQKKKEKAFLHINAFQSFPVVAILLKLKRQLITLPYGCWKI